MRQVSVVVPSFNRAHLLPQTIVTYLQPEVAELILVDDGSKDHTTEVVTDLQKIDPRIIYIRQSVNAGQQAAKNVGINLVKTPYIYFGDDDSVLGEGSIKNALDCMEAEGADLVGVKAIYMLNGETFKEVTERHLQGRGELLDINRLRANFSLDVDRPVQLPFVHASFLIKTDIAKEILFDSIYIGSAYREETDFMLRCSEAGHKIVYFSKGVQINLPRNIASGGAWSHGWFVYEWSAIRNNWIFLRRHHAYLTVNWKLQTGMARLQMLFIAERMQALFKRLIKQLFFIQS